ncbi:light-regulated protein, chloroplastic-like [Cucurbita pepo subsp. pepo]|uniref:light-regulated protein, chloroplastic-like n=1 Tax=Cucurbita pepo subsp. pepo TaxID=3664 RepID=UPI000C9D29C4|nr:light-regulated protein, chloroplastic-like [Cucurbita pepo subsp. pepo]
MQAVLSIVVPPLLPSLTPSNNLSHFPSSPSIRSLSSSRRSTIKAVTAVAYDTSVVDYSSVISVFPAEACETIGGEACWANIFPEVRLQASADSAEAAAVALEEIDREYLDYAAQSKTVFPGEACDDLGGEFCGAEFLNGVF